MTRDPHEGAKLVVKNGKLMIVSTFTHYNEPTIVYQFWPIWPDGWTVEGAQERGLVGAEAKYNPGGTYSVWDEHRRISQTFQLTHRGRTVAEIIEYEEIPRPQTRLPVRWAHLAQRWEKETKKGWVPA